MTLSALLLSVAAVLLGLVAAPLVNCWQPPPRRAACRVRHETGPVRGPAAVDGGHLAGHRAGHPAHRRSAQRLRTTINLAGAVLKLVLIG
jgi:hypothetical protein